MAKRINCCECGTVVLASPTDASTWLALCSTCWSRLPAHEIIRRSHAHDDGATECPRHSTTRQS